MFVYILGICFGLTANVLSSTSPSSVTDAYYPNSNWSDTFDWKLLKEFSPQYKNVILSPISLKVVLALLYQGSSEATAREFENVLQFTDKKSVREYYREILSALKVSESDEYVLNMGTRIFLASAITPKQKFASRLKDFFRTDIELTNFTNPEDASSSINSWTEKLTNGRIPEIVKPGDLKDAIMLIANALYFKGSWRHQFPRNNTHVGKFRIPLGDSLMAVSCPFMTVTEKFYYLESPSYDAKIIRLPYKGSNYSMFIILPNSRGGLSSLLRKVNLHSLKSLLYLMDLREVTVSLPKFKFDFQARLTKALQEFGLRQMFQNTASFSGIATGNNTLLRMLVVSDIIQKSGIEINEEGSIAYVATEVTIGNKIGEEEAVFEAAHPFMFFIEEENTGSILFVGKVENPLEEEPVPLGSPYPEF